MSESSQPLQFTPPARQEKIQSSRAGRTASLLGTGAKVGINYLKHYGKRSVGGSSTRQQLDQQNAEDVYETFSKLKGGPLKMAQMLSVDQSLLPPAYAKEFSKAQYSAPPLSYPLVVRTFRREFGKSPTEIFDAFTPEAAHGASIGQVHRASLNGKDLAVKVQYPGVADSLKSDLAIVKPIALQIMGMREEDLAMYFEEVRDRLLEETDYALELQRSIDLSKRSSHLDHVRFPTYYPEFSSKRILTMDWIEGKPLDQFAAANPSQELKNQVGQALWDFYHHQIHELQMFHADPHPGNFLVDTEGCLIGLDFGCTKQLSDDFYRKNFVFLDPAVTEDRQRLEACLEDLNILLPTDSPEQRQTFLDVCVPSIELLARPFRAQSFDFADKEFLAAIYEMGQSNRQNEILKSMRGARGSAHSIYVNRTYFGLYSLLARLECKINTYLPEWVQAHSPEPLLEPVS
jgi:predicted unusual protein kinase regulating ubiquinone biosynthesis (AarF/ABC1/UbiB family)